MYYNIIHHIIFVFFIYFFSSRKDQFIVLSLKFGSIVLGLLDYEQCLFFLSPSSKTRETLK